MRYWGKRAAGAAVAALLSAICAHADDSAEKIAAMKEIQRTVYGTPPQGTQSVKRIGDGVLFKELIETRDESRALLEFIDGSHLTLGSKSKVLIDAFVFDPAKSQGNALINLSVGTLRFVTGAMPKGGVVIKTPTATLTLRGTIVTVHVHPDGTTDTTVDEGHVDAHNDTTNQTADLGPGDGTTTDGTGNEPFQGDNDQYGTGTEGGDGANSVEHRRNDSTTQRNVHQDPPASSSEAGSTEEDGDDEDCECI